MRVWSARRGLDSMFAATSARCPSPRNRSRPELPALTKPRVAASTKAVTTAWTSALSLQAWSSKTECDDPRLAGTCSSCRAGISATSVADQLCAASGAERAGGAPWPAPDPAACSRSALSGARDCEGRRYQRGRESGSLSGGVGRIFVRLRRGFSASRRVAWEGSVAHQTRWSSAFRRYSPCTRLRVRRRASSE